RSWSSSARRVGSAMARKTSAWARARCIGTQMVTNRRGARQALRGVPSGPARTHARAAEDLLQLPGQGRLEPEAASILGMGDLQPLGMEEEPLQPPPRPRLAVEGEIAVLPVARHRMPDGGEVSADLVGPAGLQRDLQQGRLSP